MKFRDEQLVKADLRPAELRCIARSLHQVLADWSTDWHKTNDTLKGE